MHSLSQLCCPSQLTFFLYVSNRLHNKVEEAWWAFLFALSFSSIRNVISPLVVRANNQSRCPSGEKNTLGSNELHQHQRQVTLRRVEGLRRAKQVAEICNKSSLLLCSVDFKKAKWNACSHKNVPWHLVAQVYHVSSVLPFRLTSQSINCQIGNSILRTGRSNLEFIGAVQRISRRNCGASNNSFQVRILMALWLMH